MNCRVLGVKRSGPYARLRLEAAAIARRVQPGQFVMAQAAGANAPFWRRPFGVCQSDGRRTIELLIKAVGPGTSLIAALEQGDNLDLIGPLGRGFTVAGRGDWLLVGGGYGVAPLLFLAENLRAQGRSVEILQGAGCEDDLLLALSRSSSRAGPKSGSISRSCATEDGSFGIRGLVTGLLEQRLRAALKPVRIAACGPHAMLAAVAKLAAQYRVPAEVSLEEVMACGLGVCNGCVVTVRGSYQRVCKDGPVFNAADVDWSRP